MWCSGLLFDDLQTTSLFLFAAADEDSTKFKITTFIGGDMLNSPQHKGITFRKKP